MREAIRRALDSPPPRGAVVVVAVGLLVTIAALLLSRDPGAVGEDIAFSPELEVPQSALAPLGAGGSARIVDGAVSATEPNDFGDRLYRIVASLSAGAGRGAAIDSVRCQLRLADGVVIGQSDGRRAAFPRPLADSADDAIKEGGPVEFETDDAAQAGVELRGAFFKFVVGGDPSVSWSNLDQGQHTWLWRYEKPVARTRVNFLIVLVDEGGETAPLACTTTADGGRGRTTARTSIKLR